MRTVLGALGSLESFKVNKLAFLTKARLSFGIYPHRVLQQHSYRQAPIGARSLFWAGKCSSLAAASARKALDQNGREQSSSCSAGFLICGFPKWLWGCDRTGGGQRRAMAWPSNSISLLFYPGEKKNQGVTCGIVPQHIRSGSWQVTETTSFGVALSFFPQCSQP